MATLKNMTLSVSSIRSAYQALSEDPQWNTRVDPALRDTNLSEQAVFLE